MGAAKHNHTNSRTHPGILRSSLPTESYTSPHNPGTSGLFPVCTCNISNLQAECPGPGQNRRAHCCLRRGRLRKVSYYTAHHTGTKRRVFIKQEEKEGSVNLILFLTQYQQNSNSTSSTKWTTSKVTENTPRQGQALHFHKKLK